MFDNQQELIRKIHLGEDSLIEFKSVKFDKGKIIGPSRNKLADEIAAFANSSDGVIVLGVDDKTKEVEGIPVENLDAVESLIREICNDSIVPPLSSIKIIRMELPDSMGEMKPIIKIDIQKSLFVHKTPDGYFIRLGSSKRELTPELLARLFQQRSQARIIRFDEQPVPDTSIDTLAKDLYERFIGMDKTESLLTLKKLRLIVEDDFREEKASVSGVLMCSHNPERYLTGAYIEVVRYRGTKLDSNYQTDAKKIFGPLDKQIINTLSFVKLNMSVAATKEPGRKETPQFSMRAVFEAVVNAVAHRDYSIHGSKIRLFMFDDRLEIYSPGTIPNSMTIESLHLRQVTRNELITNLLAHCPVEIENFDSGRQYMMDKRGEGVPIILEESEKLSGKKPLYTLIDDSELLLTIYSA